MQTALNYRTNRDLFSNYYLNEHLLETEAWNELTDDELRDAKSDIMELWEREKQTAPKRNESQLEEKFIRPMFRKLGIPFEVEESTSRTQRRPDYGFFESEDAARDAFERREDGNDFYKNSVAVADAKRWGRPLDTRGSGEHERDFENPSYQIHVYLQEVDDAQWAVLTDGKKWRLYYGPTSHRLDSYYEVDLPTVLENGDLEDFKYFYLFFRHGAFLEDSSGDCFLDDVYAESNVFARELGEDLQDNIYEAIKILSEGFMQYPDNDLTEDDLDRIHDSSLIYLYRLIFVLYAESEGRDLLDTNNEIYEESYSLNTLKQDIAEELDSSNSKYRDWQDNLYDRLDELFKLIDQGSKSRGIPEEDLYIPAYNGGLFRTDPDEDDSAEARFLANHEVGDAYLAEVIELLTRSQNDNGGGKIFVDYSSLDVRHLGSIYEGLLEYQLNVADEPLTLEDGEYVPAGEGDEVIVEEGEVHLSTGSGERKATGSYYTPEYVVEYIVEETLGPLVEDCRKNALDKRGSYGGLAQAFADEVFNLKILDPAMGSGHFLTVAIDYLAREIIDAQEKQAAQEGIETVDEQRDINWARRQVAQRCIYGVDLNPLAVELAKVSLWLRTLAAEQPLAFLDHHLKTGNSLVGSDIEAVLDNGDPDNGTKEGQLTLQESFDRTRRQALEHVTDQFEDLLAIDNETLDDIKEMEAVYEEVRDDPLYQHLIAMANVHTAEQFGLDVPGDAHELMAEALRDDSWEDIKGEDWYRSAQGMAEDQRFFHWELEFPIAFYEQDGERKEDGGFDAVIGNPPYVRQEQLKESKSYFQDKYEVYHGMTDLYAYFMEKGKSLLATDGQFGYIVSNKFMRSSYGESLRKMVKDTHIREIIDFGELPVFGEDVSAYPCIILFQNKTSESDNVRVCKLDSLDFNSLYDHVDKQSYNLSVEHLPDAGWSLDNAKLTKAISGLEGERFYDYVDQEIYFGLKTGLNKAFYISEEEKDDILTQQNQELIKPIIKGTDVDRYLINNPNRYAIVIPSGWTQDNLGDVEEEIAWEQLLSKYPNIATHLSEYKERAKKRDDMGDYWWEVRPCDYYWAFEKTKIVYPDIAEESKFVMDDEGLYVDATLFAVPQDDYYLLALLNSSLLELKLKSISPQVRGGYYRYKTEYLGRIPIFEIDSKTPESERSEMVSQLLENYQEYINGGEKIPVNTHDDVLRDFLAELSERMVTYYRNHHALNLNLLDYLGIPSDELPDSKAGDTLGDLQMPAGGVADTPLTETTDEYEGLRIEDVTFEEDDARLVLSVDISYKVDDDDPRETDRWNRLDESEFETYEAMVFVGLSEAEETLLREFVPVAVEIAEGFAGFRQGATKTNSPLDRLKDLMLPVIDDVRTGLKQYIEIRERANKLELKIEKTDQLIDEIVYELYGLTDEEIEIVESAVKDD